MSDKKIRKAVESVLEKREREMEEKDKVKIERSSNLLCLLLGIGVIFVGAYLIAEGVYPLAFVDKDYIQYMNYLPPEAIQNFAARSIIGGIGVTAMGLILTIMSLIFLSGTKIEEKIEKVLKKKQ